MGMISFRREDEQPVPESPQLKPTAPAESKNSSEGGSTAPVQESETQPETRKRGGRTTIPRA